MKAPTEMQYRRLLILGAGAMVVVPGRRDWTPLLRRGWVEVQCEDDGSRYLPPLRITPDGLRALAEGVERYGLVPISDGAVQQLPEPPVVTRLKAELKEARKGKREAERESSRLQAAVRRVRQAVEQA